MGIRSDTIGIELWQAFFRLEIGRKDSAVSVSKHQTESELQHATSCNQSSQLTTASLRIQIAWKSGEVVVVVEDPTSVFQQARFCSITALKQRIQENDKHKQNAHFPAGSFLLDYSFETANPGER